MIEKPLIVQEVIEAPQVAAEEECAAKEMNHSAWRTLHALRITIEAGEIHSLAEVYGLVYALELTYEALAR